MKGYSYKISKRTKVKKIKKLVFFALVASILLLCLIFITYSDTLRVREVEVEGIVALSEGDIKNALLELTSGYKYRIIPNANIIFLSTNVLENKMRGEFTAIQKIDISRAGLYKLSVKIEEKSPKFLWCNEEECFEVDMSGTIFEYREQANLESQDRENMTVFYTEVEGGLLGAKIAEQSVRENMFKALEAFEKKGLSVSSIRSESSEKFTMTTSIGEILLNPHEEKMEEILENIFLLYDDQKSKKADALFQYIDARFGNKLFFKLEN